MFVGMFFKHSQIINPIAMKFSGVAVGIERKMLVGCFREWGAIRLRGGYFWGVLTVKLTLIYTGISVNRLR